MHGEHDPKEDDGIKNEHSDLEREMPQKYYGLKDFGILLLFMIGSALLIGLFSMAAIMIGPFVYLILMGSTIAIAVGAHKAFRGFGEKRGQKDPSGIPAHFIKRYGGFLSFLVLYILFLAFILTQSKDNFGLFFILISYGAYLVFSALPILFAAWGGESTGFHKSGVPSSIGGEMTVFGIILLLAVSILGGILIQDRLEAKRKENVLSYESSDIQLETEINYEDYLPFAEGNKVVKYDGESTLAISSNHPRLDGATALYPVYSAFVETTYLGLNSSTVEETVRCTKTSRAYESLLDGTTDLIFVAEASKGHQEEAENRGITFQMTPIGREAFVFFVNQNNPVDNLTTEQIQDIYTKKITNWSEVGGNDEEILPFQRPENSGSQTVMLSRVMKDKKMAAPLINEMMEGMGGIIHETAAYVNRDNALGYSFRFYSTEMNGDAGIKLLSVDGVAPTKENISNGTYPFGGEIYAVTTEAGMKNPHTKELLDWILSSQGQEILELSGYTNID